MKISFLLPEPAFHQWPLSINCVCMTSSMCVSLPWCALWLDLLLWTLSFPHTPVLPLWQEAVCRCYSVGAACSSFPVVSPVSCNHRPACLSLPFGGLLPWMCKWRVVLFLSLVFQASWTFPTKRRKGLSAVIPAGSALNRDVIWFGYGHMSTGLSN